MSHKKQEYYVKKFALCDRNHFLILKGIAALAAVIALFFRSYYDFSYASYIVHGAAAVFFFCSGFGVSESCRHKSGLSHYWENKMVKVWLPSAIMVITLNVVRKGNFASWIAHSPLGLMDNWLYLTFGICSGDSRPGCILAIIAGMIIWEATGGRLLRPVFALFWRGIGWPLEKIGILFQKIYKYLLARTQESILSSSEPVTPMTISARAAPASASTSQTICS